MSAITTHVLDTSVGSPAAGVDVALYIREGSDWVPLGSGTTNADGRATDLLGDDHQLQSGTYRLTFQTGAYHSDRGVRGFYPEVSIPFAVEDGSEHYHVPLLLNPFGYSTYRGS